MPCLTLQPDHHANPSLTSRFFSNASNGAPNPVHANANKLFDKYRDDPKNDPDEINIEGTSKMLGEMTIGVEDISAFIFSELVQSPALGKITREGFVDGCLETSCDTLPKIRNVVIQRRSQLSADPDIFRNVYNHAFVLGLSNNQKSLSQDVAAEFWSLLFSSQGFAWRTITSPWLEWWLEFQKEKWNKAVNKDLWRQTLTFAEQTMKDETLGFWTEDSSWPSVIDEFVEWVKTEKKGGGGEEAMDVA